MIWCKGEATLVDAYAAAVKRGAADAIKGDRRFGVRVRRDADAAEAVALELQGAAASLATRRYRVKGLAPQCAAQSQASGPPPLR